MNTLNCQCYIPVREVMSLCNANNNVWAPMEADKDSDYTMTNIVHDTFLIWLCRNSPWWWRYEHFVFLLSNIAHSGSTWCNVNIHQILPSMESENYIAESAGSWISSIPCIEFLLYRTLLRDICRGIVYGYGASVQSEEVSREAGPRTCIDTMQIDIRNARGK